ncbi:MAG: aminotransferase class IV [Spirochaetales bacterium]|nr:aminotransferase class IV [Spirochaetales bacterium]
MERTILFNGEITADTIRLTAGSEVLNYGTGFFETILYENGHLYFYEDHIERIRSALATFKKEIDESGVGEERIIDLIRHNGYEDRILRVKIICAPITGSKMWDTCVFLGEYHRDSGSCAVCIHHEPKEGFLFRFKSTNYWANHYWRTWYRDNFSADEVLFPDTSGSILEGSFTNCLAVKGKTLFYVDGRNNYLFGIMQKRIISDFRILGFTKVLPGKKGFSPAFLAGADEILLVNSLIIARTVEVLYWGSIKTICNRGRKGWGAKIRDFYLSAGLSDSQP